MSYVLNAYGEPVEARPSEPYYYDDPADYEHDEDYEPATVTVTLTVQQAEALVQAALEQGWDLGSNLAIAVRTINRALPY